MSSEERQKVKADYMGRKGFINFATGWEKQHTQKEKMVYTFWYKHK